MRASAGMSTLAPTAVMSPSRITTVPRAITFPGPVTMRALRMAWTRGVTACAVEPNAARLATRLEASASTRARRVRGLGQDGSTDRGSGITSERGRDAAGACRTARMKKATEGEGYGRVNRGFKTGARTRARARTGVAKTGTNAARGGQEPCAVHDGRGAPA